MNHTNKSDGNSSSKSNKSERRIKSDFSHSIFVAEEQLKLAEVALTNQILSYPTPIAGCDEQFNYLLAEKRRAKSALIALDTRHFVPTPRNLENNS